MRTIIRLGILTGFIILTVIMPTTYTAAADNPNRKELLNQLFASELFGETMQWYGVTGGALVSLDPTCVFPDPPGPNERCIVIDPAPALTSFDEREIISITFPKNTFKNVICPVFLNIVLYQLHNTSGDPQPNARFSYRRVLTIESEALRDPRAIDPDTGLPFDGKLEVFWGGDTVVRSLDAGEREFRRNGFSRVCNAGVSKAHLSDLPKDIVDRLFREQMTIHLGMFGNARWVDFAFVLVAMRIMGT